MYNKTILQTKMIKLDLINNRMVQLSKSLSKYRQKSIFQFNKMLVNLNGTKLLIATNQVFFIRKYSILYQVN